MRVMVVGASGYAGGELLRLIAGHPDFELSAAVAGDNAGRPIGALHPHLARAYPGDFAAWDRSLAGAADLVFLALPHGRSSSMVDQLPESALVVDLGADYRLADATAWETYYGGTHAGRWTYGLPELGDTRKHLVGATRIANPGCYPTGVILGLAPLLAAGLVEASDVVVVAASGSTGAGRGASDALLASAVMGQLSAYKVGGAHQHTPEIEQALTVAAGEVVTVSFTPMLAPMPRGILATTTARLLGDASTDDMRQCLAVAYRDELFVRVLPDGEWPQTGAVLGSNAVHLQVAADAHSGRAVIVSAIDNLGKGAAGQAIQNSNLALGMPEATGLSAIGVAP